MRTYGLEKKSSHVPSKTEKVIHYIGLILIVIGVIILLW